MNNSLNRVRIIEGSRLSAEFYFQSLLEEAYGKGLLGDSDIERVQLECFDLLAYKTERFNNGDSSSIMVEKAQSLMTSNLFTIGLWLKTYPTPEDAVEALQEISIKELYQKGCKRIDTLTLSTKTIHQMLLKQCIDTKNQFYRSTIDGGINGFFKLYNPEFAAQETHITADYQVFSHIPKLDGIEFISAYTNALYYENQFCSHFASEDIHHMLCGYVKDYSKLLINIYEFVLTAAIGCLIVGTDAKALCMSAAATQYLKELFTRKQADEAHIILQEAFAELGVSLGLLGSLNRYVQSSLPAIESKIRLAARQQTLDQIFFVSAYPENDPIIQISFGEKMEDEAYRNVLDEMGQCLDSTDRIAILKEHIHSLADLEDALLDAALTDAETQAVLQGLDLTEIAALSKRHPLLSELDGLDASLSEQTLGKNLHDFICALPTQQQKQMAKVIDAIVDES
ncbi:MAG: hypothetical protein GX096_08205 [Clostridiales bacterium]|nr:hypothetical protein [Clostridiales bacterium]